MNDLYQDSNGVIHAVKSDSMGKTIFAWTNCGRDITDFFRSNEKDMLHTVLAMQGVIYPR